MSEYCAKARLKPRLCDFSCIICFSMVKFVVWRGGAFMYNRAQLKREVKQIISVTKPRPMWVALLYLVITSVGASILQSLVNLFSGTSVISEMLSSLPGKIMTGEDPMVIFQEIILLYADRLIALVGTMIVSSLVLSVVITLWEGLMNVGFTGYCLSLVRGEKPGVNRIFCGFPMIGKVVLTSLLVWVFMTLWLLLYGICLAVVILIGALLMEAATVVGVILFVAGYIGYVILAIRLVLRYSMVNYILLDTGKFGLDAIGESKRMMKGKKGKLFMLYFSFIGWYLLTFAVAIVGGAAIGAVISIGGAGLAGGASMGALAGIVGGVMFVLLIMFAVLWLINLWLQPYVTGSAAKFYLFFKPQSPELNDGWPALHGDITDQDQANIEC